MEAIDFWCRVDDFLVPIGYCPTCIHLHLYINAPPFISEANNNFTACYTSDF